MNDSIRVLPPELQNQIAAGEVVERPSSVLKELVENSLDAGATRIRATIQGGGQSLIQVQDNGTGMSSDQLPQAMARHATSKIESFQDLVRVASFGFRGEALPSIGSVSKMSLKSIAAGEAEGAELTVEFGIMSEVKPVPFREGTTILVRDLFVNTPARLKFLKTQTTEAKRCLEVMHRFALASPEVGFTLISNERTVLDFPPVQTVLDRLQAVWPPRITEQLLPVEAEDDGYALRGYVGHPEAAQGRADRILFFVNQRPVQDKMLLRALRQAFKGRLLSKEYPQAALFLSIPAQELDVNVHPAKLEVRFRDEHRVFSLLHQGITRAFTAENETQTFPSPRQPEEHVEPTEPRYKFQTFDAFQNTAAEETRGKRWTREDEHPGLDEEGGGIPGRSAGMLEPETKNTAQNLCHRGYTYLGQVQNSYLVLASENGELVVVDQHAAHERVLFHRFTSQAEKSPSRPLAIPYQRALHPSEEEHLNQVVPALRHMGFGLDRPQGGTILIRAVPAHLDPAQAGSFLEQVLSQQTESQDELWQMVACRQAIKAGETLSAQEAMELLRIWMQTPEREYCPHGRPAMITFNAQTLENMFKRRG